MHNYSTDRLFPFFTFSTLYLKCLLHNHCFRFILGTLFLSHSYCQILPKTVSHEPLCFPHNFLPAPLSHNNMPVVVSPRPQAFLLNFWTKIWIEAKYYHGKGVMYRKTQKYAWWELLYNSLNFLCLVLCHQCQLVPDDTVHKGASKHQKMDEKHPFCGARFSIDIYIWKFSLLHPSPFQKWSELI